jgi:DNA polymerase-3 subunit beta
MQCIKCQAPLYPGEPRCDQCGELVGATDLSSPVQAERSAPDTSPVASKPPPNSFALPERELRRLLALVQYAMGPPERPAVNGVRMVLDPPELTLVATDGHRLVATTYAVDVNQLGAREVTMPRAAISKLIETLTNSGDPVVIGLLDNEAVIRFGGKKLATQFIQGQFPDYKRVFSTGNTNLLRVNRAGLMQALHRLNSGDGARTRSAWTLSAGSLSIAEPDRGGTQQQLAVTYTGTPMRIGFDPRYVLDALSQLDCEEIEIALHDAHAPGILSIPARDDFKCVLMPIRL